MKSWGIARHGSLLSIKSANRQRPSAQSTVIHSRSSRYVRPTRAALDFGPISRQQHDMACDELMWKSENHPEKRTLSDVRKSRPQSLAVSQMQSRDQGNAICGTASDFESPISN